MFLGGYDEIIYCLLVCSGLLFGLLFVMKIWCGIFEVYELYGWYGVSIVINWYEELVE